MEPGSLQSFDYPSLVAIRDCGQGTLRYLLSTKFTHGQCAINWGPRGRSIEPGTGVTGLVCTIDLYQRGFQLSLTRTQSGCKGYLPSEASSTKKGDRFCPPSFENQKEGDKLGEEYSRGPNGRFYTLVHL